MPTFHSKVTGAGVSAGGVGGGTGVLALVLREGFGHHQLRDVLREAQLEEPGRLEQAEVRAVIVHSHGLELLLLLEESSQAVILNLYGLVVETCSCESVVVDNKLLFVQK